MLVYSMSFERAFIEGLYIFIIIIDGGATNARTRYNNQRSSLDVCRNIWRFIWLGFYSAEEKFLICKSYGGAIALTCAKVSNLKI
jgi:putative methionine-R-sulfoxide reductase with GAF domain